MIHVSVQAVLSTITMLLETCTADSKRPLPICPDVPPVGSKTNRDLRFIQLYTSPHYERHRNKLVIPTDIPDENDVDKHNFSPLVRPMAQARS